MIQTTRLDGHGKIEVSGGAGYTRSGPGSGGYIATNYVSKSGDMQYETSGGRGAVYGASGVLYESKSGRKNMFVNGYERSSIERTVIACDAGTSVEYSSISLNGKAKFGVQICSTVRQRTVFVDALTGDHNNEFFINDGVEVYLAYKGESSYELAPSVRLLSGGSLQVPNKFSLKPSTKLFLGGKLVGGSYFTLQPDSQLTLRHPGYSSYVDLTFSRFSFRQLVIEPRASVIKEGVKSVRVDVTDYELQYNGRFSSLIPLVVTGKNSIQSLAPSLSRASCPHGHEIVNISSDRIYDPCGTGKLVHAPRNVSYQINVTRYRNTSFTEIRPIANTTLNMTVTNYTMTPYAVEVTRWKIVHNISCDYNSFTLLAGQKCSVKPGSYKYASLTIQQTAEMRFDSNGIDKITFDVGEMKVLTNGKVTVLPHSVPNVETASTDLGGSYGGRGGRGQSASVPGNVTGDVLKPKMQGRSGGGGRSGHIGKGGGQLHLRVSTELNNDGTIDVNGGSGTGGGSGGSLLVEGGTIKGRGTFNARGGAGQVGIGGGGGGGRIAIYSDKAENYFKGKYSVLGGDGHSKGQPGTVVFGTKSKVPVVKLHLIEAGTVAMPNDAGSLHFDLITLGKSVHLDLKDVALQTGKLVTFGGCSIDVFARSSLIVNSTDNHVVKCGLHVRENGLLSFSGPIQIDSSALNPDIVSGNLKAPSITINPRRTLSVIGKGRVTTDKLYIGRNSNLSLSVGSRVWNESRNQVNLHELHLSMAASIYLHATKVLVSSRTVKMAQSSSILFSSQIDLTINSDDIDIENRATISVLGSQATSVTASSGNVSCGFGGSHGGRGGGRLTGQSYGVLVRPRSFGSKGGNAGSSLGGVGGGIFVINAKRITLNGVISTNGESSRGSPGGGSGGSLHVTATTLTGHGKISANGGDSLCGGGSGGRIALHVGYRRTFKGVITAYGGKGAYPGAAGTVFIAEKVVGIDVNTTVIDNNGLRTASEANVGADGAILTMQNLVISGQARLAFSSKSGLPRDHLVIKFSKVLGDLSGVMKIAENQSVYLQTSQAYSERPFMLPCSLSVNLGGTLYVSNRLFVTKTVNQPSLHIAGLVVGGENIIAGKQGGVVVARTGRIGIPTGQARVFSFRAMSVLSQGAIDFQSDMHEVVEVNSESINIGYGGKLKGVNLRIKTPSLIVAYSGRITTDGAGYKSSSGQGAGKSVATGGAGGGSYGGFSGAGSSANGTKSVYGSLFKATLLGSGGGDSGSIAGGAGGGTVMIQVADLRLDGIVSANGLSGGQNAGGGSGGSVHVQSSKFSGLGSIYVHGGPGLGGGGSGSGGRISIRMDSEFSFKGIVDASGGKKTGIGGFSGSPGTIYVKDIRNEYFPRQILIIHNRLNLDYLLETTLNQTIPSYSFDRLLLKGGVTLHFDKNCEIQNLDSDVRSILHVPDHVILNVERQRASSSIQASFHVNKFGEVRLASKVTFLGLDNHLLGTLTGIFDFNVGETKSTTLSASGRTAQYKDGKYVFISNRGEYKFIKLTLQNRAKLMFEDSTARVIPISLASLEMRYGSVLSAPRLFVDAGDVTLHIGAKIDTSGTMKASNATRKADGGNNCGYGGGRTVSQNRILSSVEPNLTGEAGGGQSFGGLSEYFILFDKYKRSMAQATLVVY